MESITLNHLQGNGIIRHVTLIINPNDTMTLLGNLPHLAVIELTQELIDALQDALNSNGKDIES